jgi:hypothetical protein
MRSAMNRKFIFAAIGFDGSGVHFHSLVCVAMIDCRSIIYLLASNFQK